MEISGGITALLAAAGVLLILTAIIGGGLEIKEVKIPQVSLVPRILAFCVGVCMLAIGLVPGLVQDTSSTEPESSRPEVTVERTNPPAPAEAKEALVEVPDVMGYSEEEAREAIEGAGLRVGRIDSVSRWRPDGKVLAQNPAEGDELVPGSLVDITTADSHFKFVASHRAVTSDESLQVELEYAVRLLDGGNGRHLAEFELARAIGRPQNDGVDHVLGALVDTRGYVAPDALQEKDILDGWEAAVKLQQDLQSEMHDNTAMGTGDFSQLGPTIIMAFAMIEFQFDIRAMFLTAEKVDETGQMELLLQEGTEQMSTIRVVGPGTLTRAGKSLSFVVERKAPNQSNFAEVGRAYYKSEDGLLEELRVQFLIGEGDGQISYTAKLNRR